MPRPADDSRPVQAARAPVTVARASRDYAAALAQPWWAARQLGWLGVSSRSAVSFLVRADAARARGGCNARLQSRRWVELQTCVGRTDGAKEGLCTHLRARRASLATGG